MVKPPSYAMTTRQKKEISVAATELQDIFFTKSINRREIRAGASPVAASGAE
jgi:hypothetical protein